MDAKPETRRYLTAAVFFLERRSFSCCRSYALRAKESDPTHPCPNKILCIASVLSAPEITPELPDYYTIFSLPRFESDADQIRSSFKTLSSTLDPELNPYPNSSEALDLVRKGWSVLSNPLEKARFDADLMRNLSGHPPENGGDTFWTMCPYCYYVYQYERVFEECCLRCTNESCRRGFHAVPVGEPPAEVVAKGEYCCPGFMPLESRNNNGDVVWLPFGHPIRGSNVQDKRAEGTVGATDEANEVKDRGIQHHGRGRKGKKMRPGGAAGSSGLKSKSVGNEDEKSGSRGGRSAENGVKETTGGRGRKSVAWSSKKLMGRGCKINRNVTQSMNDVGEEWELPVNGNEDLETGFGDVMNEVIGGRVEFFEGGDDVLVGVQTAFDFGIVGDL